MGISMLSSVLTSDIAIQANNCVVLISVDFLPVKVGKL